MPFALLLKAGAEPNARRSDGSTALHTSVWCDADPTVVDMLLAAGADPAFPIRRASGPSDYALRPDDLEL